MLLWLSKSVPGRTIGNTPREVVKTYEHRDDERLENDYDGTQLENVHTEPLVHRRFTEQVGETTPGHLHPTSATGRSSGRRLPVIPTIRGEQTPPLLMKTTPDRTSPISDVILQHRRTLERHSGIERNSIESWTNQVSTKTNGNQFRSVRTGGGSSLG